MLKLPTPHSSRRLCESSLVYEKTCDVEYALLDAAGKGVLAGRMNELDELKSFTRLSAVLRLRQTVTRCSF